jgi:hypothetical protein
VSVQTPLQNVVPRTPQSGVHWNWLHADPGGHVSPHFPQFVWLDLRSKHDPLQLVVPPGHASAHCPPTHGSPPGQARPHVPQFWGFDVKSTHAPEQNVPLGQVTSMGATWSTMLVSRGPTSGGPPPSSVGWMKYESESSADRPQPLPAATRTTVAKVPHNRNRSKLAMGAPRVAASRPASGRRRSAFIACLV